MIVTKVAFNRDTSEVYAKEFIIYGDQYRDIPASDFRTHAFYALSGITDIETFEGEADEALPQVIKWFKEVQDKFEKRFDLMKLIKNYANEVGIDIDNIMGQLDTDTLARVI